MSDGKSFGGLAISRVEDFIYGTAPKPVRAGRGVEIGTGMVVPEVNFTLPPMEIKDETWPRILREYSEMTTGVCSRAVELGVEQLIIEIELLPPMTTDASKGLEIARTVSDIMKAHSEEHGQKNALRLTPNDNRDHIRPPLMRSGKYWDGMVELFRGAGEAGADLLAMESTGGKEVCDDALTYCDIEKTIFALGILGARDMSFVWKEMVKHSNDAGIVPSGDTACGFANTAMVMADQGLIPKVFSAAVRVASVPRGLVSYKEGAVGPSKDCGYEGPYFKAITGTPISMEGSTAACAHLSHVGNISRAVADCWSNESVSNVRLLSTNAPTVSLEQLAYDVRLLNLARQDGLDKAHALQDLFVRSDAGKDPQAFVLHPEVVLRISERIIGESTPYLQTIAGVTACLDEMEAAQKAGTLHIRDVENRWLPRMRSQLEGMPDDEDTFVDRMLSSGLGSRLLPAEYGL